MTRGEDARRVLKTSLSLFRNGLADIVYPRRCGGCGLRGTWLCNDCDSALPRYAAPWCSRCGVPTNVAACRCDRLPVSLDRVRTVASYDGWLRSAIVSFKFHDEQDRAGHLGAMLSPLLDDLAPIDAVVPVPLHPRRERERGFNQALLLARYATNERFPLREDILVRSRPTRHQVGLGADERRANVHEAFAVLPGVSLQSLRLVLVDDVLTTGSTLGNCADALRAAGARSVSAVTLAGE